MRRRKDRGLETGDRSHDAFQDLVEYIEAQRCWSIRIFGEGQRTKGICEHIRKELLEIEAMPLDVFEWVDVIILALDGAWRAGYTAEQIVAALKEKQRINFSRTWGTKHNENEPTEHER